MANQRPRPRRDDFEIAIICALQAEADAVEAMFDSFWESEQPYRKATGDTNAYTVGTIGGHDTVLAFMPGIGKVHSARVAASFRSTFPGIKLGLVVGICGGVPAGTDDQKEIILGDVIISTGIIQFDRGRQFSEKMERKDTPQDSLSPPNPEIRSFLAKISGFRGRQSLSDSISTLLADLFNTHGFENWTYPGTDKDRLYKAIYRHKHHDPTICSTCAQCQSKDDEVCNVAKELSCADLHCNDDQLVLRNRLGMGPAVESNTAAEDAPKPAIHFGLIASGDQVMKSAYHRDEIARKEKVIAFEMEGAGVWESFPTIVVKGVCDYADSHKNKLWQNYAAATAAACMKAVLKQWSTTSKSSETIGMTDLANRKPQSLTHNEDPYYREAWQLERLETSQPYNWKKNIHRLSDYDHERVNQRLRSRRVQGTTEWFLQNATFREWSSSDISFLWLYGNVGSGKTMICSRLTDHLVDSRKATGDAIVSFYCGTSTHKTASSLYMLKSLTKQLLDSQVYCPQEAVYKLEKFLSPAGCEPDWDDIADLFSILFGSVPRAWYIIDGFDELEPGEIPRTLSYFYDLLKRASTQKLLIASRHIVGAKQRIHARIQFQIVEQETKDDIERFVDVEMLRKTECEGKLSNNDGIIHLTKQALSDGAHGMFLWVRLQIDALWTDCQTDGQILEALDHLPRDLPTTYQRCLERVPESLRDIRPKVLRWVTYAERPLHITELREAVGFKLTDHKWGSIDLPSERNIIPSCGNLIVLDEADHSVGLVHPSAKEFICGSGSFVPTNFSIEEEKAILNCGEECVNYLSFSDFGLEVASGSTSKIQLSVPSPQHILGSVPFSKVTKMVSRLVAPTSKTQDTTRTYMQIPEEPLPTDYEKYKLLDYARRNWATQTKSISEQSPVWNQFRKLALQPNTTWKTHPWNPSGQSHSSHLHGLLAYATRTRHLPLIQIVLEETENDRQQNFYNLPFVEDGLPALHAASRLGFADVVSLLLKVCQANALDVSLRTALHYAAEKNHVEVAQILLHVPRIQPAILSTSKETALGLAAGLGFNEMTELLLDRKVELLPDGPIQSNPIIAAAKKGHSGIVELLLKRTTKSGFKKRVLDMAFSSAASNGHEAVVRALLWRDGVHVNSKNKIGQTPLSCAAERGHEAVVRVLLSRDGVDVNSKSNSGDTPLLYAAAEGHGAAVRALLSRDGVDVNPKNYSGTTPLLCAAEYGREAVVRALLSRDDVDVTSKDKSGKTPLLCAAERGQEAVVRVLLSRDDVDVNSKDKSGETPLSFAARNGWEAVVRVLLSQDGVDVKSKSNSGETPLSYAARNDWEAVVRVLLSQDGVDVDSKNNSGQTPLSYAAERGHEAVVRVLLSRDGVDVNSKDNSGETPLSYAVRNGHEAVVWALKLALASQT